MPVAYDPARPVYIHTINKLRTARTADYHKALEAECLPAFREHGLDLHASWETGPGQGRGPETIEIWELRDFKVYSAFVAASHGDKADPRLQKWRETRDQWVAESDNMLCLPHPRSPTLAEIVANKTRAKLIVHEFVHTAPSMQAEYLDGIYRLWWKVAEPAGRSLLGLYYSPWNNRRAINIWGVGKEWDNLPLWGANYSYDSDEFRLWMTMGHALRDDWDDRFMVPAPYSPIR